MFCLVCVWINGWENNREAGDLRRYRAHCDVTAMYCIFRANMYHSAAHDTDIFTMQRYPCAFESADCQALPLLNKLVTKGHSQNPIKFALLRRLFSNLTFAHLTRATSEEAMLEKCCP